MMALSNLPEHWPMVFVAYSICKVSQTANLLMSTALLLMMQHSQKVDDELQKLVEILCCCHPNCHAVFHRALSPSKLLQVF
jgi:hypothetical protein